MVKNIPTNNDFGKVANHLLHKSWNTVIEILLSSPTFYLGKVQIPDKNSEESPCSSILDNDNRAFWSEVGITLSACITSITQAVEFFLKGKICDISPYLLISSEVKGWPKRSDAEDVDYADFKTVDAQDLLKIHDTFCPSESRMGNSFKDWYLQLRKERNKIMHTVDKGAQYDPRQALVLILECHQFFYGERNWANGRRIFLRSDPMTSFFYQLDKERQNAAISSKILIEMYVLFTAITPSQSMRFFNFRKKDRASLCPVCVKGTSYHFSDEPHSFMKTLQEVKGEGVMSCFICGHKAVYSGPCCTISCIGDTLDFHSKKCLWCETL